MQLDVTLTQKEQEKIAAVLNRGVDGPLAFWRLVVLAAALAPPVYTLIAYAGKVDMGTILTAIFTYPVLYIGLVLYLLLSAPGLKLLGYNGAARIGGRVLNGETHSYHFDGASFTRSQNGAVVSAYNFSAVGEIRRKGGFILVLQQNILLAALPERSFASRADATATDNTLRSAVAYARGGYAQPLAAAMADCMWRFQYLVDAGLGLAANTLVRSANPGKQFTRRTTWTVCMVLLLLLLAGFTAMLVLGSGFGAPYGMFYAVWLPAFCVLAARNPARVGSGPVLPGYTYGTTTMEIRGDGLRVWGPQYEEQYAWRDLTGVLHGNGFGLVMRRAVAAAALPYNVAPPEVVRQAMEHISRNANGGTPAPAIPEAPHPAEPTF